MKLAVMTPRRLQSEMLIRRLVQRGLTPSLVLYHKKPDLSGMARWKKSAKDSIRSLLYYNSPSERIRRIRRANEREAHHMLEQYARLQGLDRDCVLPNIVHDIRLVNHADTEALLRLHEIDVLFIWGVPIIRSNIIGSVRRMVINAHSSILPEYRGARSEFWQCYQQDFTHAGITLHQVDVGVDTGDILKQIKAEPKDCINPECLRMSNALRVIDGLPALLNDIQSGKVQRIPQSELSIPKTPTYRIKDVGMRQLSQVYLGMEADPG